MEHLRRKGSELTTIRANTSLREAYALVKSHTCQRNGRIVAVEDNKVFVYLLLEIHVESVLPMNLVGVWNELDKNQVQTLGGSLESEHRSETDTPA